MKVSSGILLIYKNNYLIAKPSGDNKIWSIPKGEIDEGETIEQTARRELLEETGIVAPEKLNYLGKIVYKNKKKTVHCFYAHINEIPIMSFSWEIETAEFLPIETVKKLLHSDQFEFLKLLNNL